MDKINKKSPIDYRCLICGSLQKQKPQARITDKHTAVKCNNCRTVSVYPMPSEEELVKYYENYHFGNDDEEENAEIIERHEKVLKILLSAMGNNSAPSFLDYGFGKGAFLKLIAKKGFYAVGAEFTDKKCKRLERYCRRENVRIETVNISRGPFKAPDRPFDCVTLFQVIEHMMDPVGFLSFLSSMQKPGGILYIECPNNDALYLKPKNIVRRLVGRENHFDSLNPFQHLYGFNRHSINTLLKKAGYTPVEVSDYPFGDGMHQIETMFWYPTLSDLLKDKNRRNFYQISKFLIRSLDPLISKFFGRGGGLYALARKGRACQCR